MKFSVLLSVYCKEEPSYVDQAFLSIWDQQTLKPNQIVLVKDGYLTSELDGVIDEWELKLGDVLTIVALPENVGLGTALNAGLEACQHELVARMDTDDISFPDRFEKQVAFMQDNPAIVAASAQLEEWNESLTQCLGIRRLPCNHNQLIRMAQTRSPLSHPLSILRRNVVMQVGGYPRLRKAQDYGLWSLLIKNGYQLANLPDVLLKMRAGNGLYGRRGWDYFRYEAELLRYQRNIQFLSAYTYYRNLFAKGALRLSPGFVKHLAYKLAR